MINHTWKQKNQDEEIQSKCNTKLEISFEKRIKNWEIKKKNGVLKHLQDLLILI